MTFLSSIFLKITYPLKSEIFYFPLLLNIKYTADMIITAATIATIIMTHRTTGAEGAGVGDGVDEGAGVGEGLGVGVTSGEGAGVGVDIGIGASARGTGVG